MREHRGCSCDDGTTAGGTVLGEEVGGAATRLVDDAHGGQAVPRVDDRLDVSNALPGGGHNYASASSSTGLLISTRAMAKASLRGSVLTAQAGVRNVDLLNLLPQGGAGTHLLPGGTCPGVGVAGLTLGGGIGPNAPWGGLSADHLREVTMVTADGDIVTASAKQNPELFWGLRGAAGGNFGVVTKLVYDLVEVPVKRATTFLLKFSDSANVIAAGVAWQAIRATGGKSLSGTWNVTSSTTGVTARVRAQVLMTEADARSLMAPLLALPMVSAEVVERSWWDTYSWYVTPVTPSNTFWDRSLFAEKDLPADLINSVVNIISRFPRPQDGYGGFGIMGWIGGQVNQVRPHETAYVHRNATSLLEFNSGWPDPLHPTKWPTPVPADVVDWMDELWETVYPFTSGQSHQNCPDPKLHDWARAYYGENLRRLSKVKTAWDPDNVFTYRQGVPLL